MTMPDRLVFVRHGHSEGNLANESSRNGDDSFFTPEFRDRPGRNWRLTDQGREQAAVAGQWIKDNIGTTFDRYYVSPFVRTKETAALLGLPAAQWRVAQRLRERDWGDISAIPRNEFVEGFPLSARTKRIDSLYWRAPGGESIADVRMRVREFLDTLHREMGGRSVIAVVHGEYMWAVRAELEYMSDEEFVASEGDPTQRIHNTQVLEYSRLHPVTGEQAKYLNWRRSTNPWTATAASAAMWSEITRPTFSNEDLLAQVNTVPRLSTPLDTDS